jgi:hypothetical protein
MGKFITYSELDTAIQRRMANQAPDSSRRLEAINDVLGHLSNEYDIMTMARKMTKYIVPDGRAYYIESDASDFKNVKDLRNLAQGERGTEYVSREEDEFEQTIGQGRLINEYTTMYRDGNIYLKVNSADGPEKVTLHGMSSSSDNGTVTALNDAVSVSTTDVRVLEQENSITFNIDVSNSGNNSAGVYIDDMSAVDLSDYNGLGIIKFWTYIPSVTNFTSITARWGSSDSAYWSASATTQADGTELQAGWNFIQIDWADATETGSVDEDNIDYLAVILNYEATYTDQTQAVIEAVCMYLPQPFEIVYNTYFVSRTTAGTVQEDVTETDTDELLLPIRYKELAVLKCLQWLAPMALGDDANAYMDRWERQEMREKKKLGMDIGKKLKSHHRKVKIHKPY